MSDRAEPAAARSAKAGLISAIRPALRPWCASCSPLAGMPLTPRIVHAVLLAVLSIAPHAAAQGSLDRSVSAPHVRPVNDLRSLVEEAAQRSPEVRALIDRLEATDVIVYIRGRNFADPELDGRVALLAATKLQRYLVIELSCMKATLVQMATLGHELYHAVEIAEEPSIVDARTLAAHYRRIGEQQGDAIGRQTFETGAAFEAGRRTRRELLTNRTRTANGS
jgi:hypothetical protein